METLLQPTDVFLTRGNSWISRSIRFFTRRIGEPRTNANHTGIVVVGGPIREAIVVEALSTVKKHPLASRYVGKKGTQVAVYRPLNLAETEKQVIVAAAEGYVGRSYGWFQLVGHLADWVLQGAYVFRRLTGSDRYPICSWVVAHAFAKAGKNFGVPPGAASPDDIHDFVEENGDVYAKIRGFEPIPTVDD